MRVDKATNTDDDIGTTAKPALETSDEPPKYEDIKIEGLALSPPDSSVESSKHVKN